MYLKHIDELMTIIISQLWQIKTQNGPALYIHIPQEMLVLLLSLWSWTDSVVCWCQSLPQKLWEKVQLALQALKQKQRKQLNQGWLIVQSGASAQNKLEYIDVRYILMSEFNHARSKQVQITTRKKNDIINISDLSLQVLQCQSQSLVKVSASSVLPQSQLVCLVSETIWCKTGYLLGSKYKRIYVQWLVLCSDTQDWLLKSISYGLSRENLALLKLE